MSALLSSPFFGISLTILAYWVGTAIQKKTGLILCNAVVIASLLVLAVLLLFDIPYEDYRAGGDMISMLLAPATACLAVAIYSRLDLLRKNWLPILVGCAAGTLTSLVSVYGLCRLFGLDQVLTASLLPKSVTTPIAVAVSSSHGGIPSITVAAVVITGISGNLMAPALIRIFRVRDPLAAGLGIGACSHAMGTSKSLELGETEGAMSGLAMGLCGLLTVVAAMFF